MSQDSEINYEELPRINYDWGFGKRNLAVSQEEYPSVLKFKHFATSLFQEREEKAEDHRKSIETPLFGNKRAEMLTTSLGA